ncbi:MAG: tyrosine-type recombinase/integrase [Ktedonobacterales bacterium]
MTALVAHRERQACEQAPAGAAWQDHDLAYPTESGTLLSADTVQYQFWAALKAAGLPKVGFHNLRHTCATLLLGQHVNPKIVSAMLGHATVAITLDIYSHVLPDMQQDATAVLDALLADLRKRFQLDATSA